MRERVKQAMWEAQLRTQQSKPQVTKLTTVVSNTATNENNPLTIILKVKKEVKIPKFNGTEGGVEPFVASLQSRLRELRQSGEEDPDAELLSKLSAGMVTQEAQLWYNNIMEGGYIQSIEDFCQELRMTFVEQTSILDRDEVLARVVQAPLETISIYATNLATKARALGFDREDSIISKCFIKGLRNAKLKNLIIKDYQNKGGKVSFQYLRDQANRLAASTSTFPSTTNTTYPKPQAAPVMDQQTMDSVMRELAAVKRLLEEKESNSASTQRNPKRDREESK